MGKASKAQTQKLQTIDDKLKELKTVEIGVTRGMRSLDFFQWHLHFNDVFQQKGGFDVVIGNPPYVRQEKLGEQLKEALQAEFPELFRGTADIYTYFYGKGVELLHQTGHLAFITSNKWFRRGYGANLRKYISKNCGIHSIVDFGELPVFDAATFPMIFIAQRQLESKEDQSVQFAQVKSLDSPYPNVSTILQKDGQLFSSKSLSGESWTFASTGSSIVIEKMKQNSSPLESYVNGGIFYGVKTGLNKAFIIDGQRRRELIEQNEKSVEIIKPLAVGDNIRKWRINREDKWLIFTRRGTNIDTYPAIKSYLESLRVQLEPKPRSWLSRDKWTGRKSGSYKWFEIQDEVAYYNQFAQPKIIYPDMCKESRFTFDTTGIYTNDATYIIPTNDLYLLGVLNSRFVWEYLKRTAEVFGDPDAGGRSILKRLYMERVPIPNSQPAERQIISNLVKKCLDAKGQNVAAWEAEINDRVAHLYGLTAAEIAQVSEQWGKT